MERIGLIDLGSNTARLVVFDILDGGYFCVVDEMRETVRLGEMEKDNVLKSSRMAQAISTLKLFQKVCEVQKTDRIVAFTTAAVRMAKNQKTFLNEVFTATGIRLRVLSEEEEATYIYQGVINSMDIPKGLIMEIGGGSTKLVYYNRRNILHQEVLPFGEVTLSELGEKDSDEDHALVVEAFVKEQLSKVEWLQELEPEVQLIGVGGTFRNLARISHKIKKVSMEMIHNYHISSADFDNIYHMMKVLDIDKKVKIRGLSSLRADIFPSALSAIKAVMEYCHFDTIITGSCAVREGMMFNYAVPQTLEKPISDVLGHSLHTYMKKLHCDEAHGEQVFNLCVQLFKQLRVLHKFPRSYVKILRTCALLCDAGLSFKFYKNQKHAAYVILNATLYGLSHHDIIVAAMVTDIYDREDANVQDWARYRDVLTDEDLDAVRKLAVILRLAVALDKSRNGVVTEINCDALGDSVIMKLETQGDALLELREAQKALGDFKKVFRKNLEIL